MKNCSYYMCFVSCKQERLIFESRIITLDTKIKNSTTLERAFSVLLDVLGVFHGDIELLSFQLLEEE